MLEDFLSGNSKNAASWIETYTSNVLLNKTAQLIVWSQGGKTFTMSPDGLIDNAGQPYKLTGKPVKLAHPMEMTAAKVEAWQKYFAENDLKQPFAQVWEPVRNPEYIKPDRYKGIMIPYSKFMNKKKHGSIIEEEGYHEWVGISFSGMDADVDRIDFERHHIGGDQRFEIKSIGFKKYSRMVNHIITYLDSICIESQIKSDDVDAVYLNSPDLPSLRYSTSSNSQLKITP